MWSKLIISDIHWEMVVEKYWKPLFSVVETLRSSKRRKLRMYLKSALLRDAQWCWIRAEVFQAAFAFIGKCCGICGTKQECCVRNKGCGKNIMMQYRRSLPRTLLIHYKLDFELTFSQCMLRNHSLLLNFSYLVKWSHMGCALVCS